MTNTVQANVEINLEVFGNVKMFFDQSSNFVGQCSDDLQTKRSNISWSG